MDFIIDKTTTIDDIENLKINKYIIKIINYDNLHLYSDLLQERIGNLAVLNCKFGKISNLFT